MPKPGLADLVLAPLTLVERSTALLSRSKGWKRRGLILLYLDDRPDGGRRRLA